MGNDAIVFQPGYTVFTPPPTPTPPARIAAPPPPAPIDDAPALSGHVFWEGFQKYAADNLKIVDKAGNLVSFILNTTQQRLLDLIIDLARRGIPPRVISLKSRQVGISTLAEGMFFYACHELANRSALVIAHNEKSTKTLFRMTHRFFRNLPKELRQATRLKSVRELQFENESHIQVETVGDVRGYTAQYAHLSELAFWGEQAPEAFIAVMQAVPRTPDSLVIIESTANGVGDKFHTLWKHACDPDKLAKHQAERGWTPLFVPWFDHEEYQSTPWFTPGETVLEERELYQRYPKKITMRRLAWRRTCIESNLDGDEEKYNREYPDSPASAFLLSGRKVFDRKALEFYLARIPPAVSLDTLPKPHEIEWDEVEKKPMLVEVQNGRLRVYREPQERHSYVVGADPSEGDPGSDPSPLAVLDQQTLSLVALWHGRMPPDELGKVATWLARYFNDALIINEANNHGIAFHNAVMDLEYPHLYFRRASSESVAEKFTLKPGFMTSSNTRHGPINTFRRLCRDKVRFHYHDTTRLLPDPTLIGEMETFVYKQRPGQRQAKAEAEGSSHDDTVMAFALALWAHRGSMQAPLEPLPPAELSAHADTYYRLKERDPEAAARFPVDILNMTANDYEAALDAEQLRERARALNGLSRMV